MPENHTAMKLRTSSSLAPAKLNPGALQSHAQARYRWGAAIVIASMFAIAAEVQAVNQYRSNGTGGGNWNATTTWQLSTDGGANWGAAAATPTSADDTIEIRSGDT